MEMMDEPERYSNGNVPRDFIRRVGEKILAALEAADDALDVYGDDEPELGI